MDEIMSNKIWYDKSKDWLEHCPAIKISNLTRERHKMEAKSDWHEYIFLGDNVVYKHSHSEKSEKQCGNTCHFHSDLADTGSYQGKSVYRLGSDPLTGAPFPCTSASFTIAIVSGFSGALTIKWMSGRPYAVAPAGLSGEVGIRIEKEE